MVRCTEVRLFSVFSPGIGVGGGCVTPLLAALLLGCGNDTSLQRAHSRPIVTIVTPADGEVLRQGLGALALTGTVSDAFDAPGDIAVTLTVTDAALLPVEVPVTVAGEGAIAGTVDIDLLALGTVTLTLTATDTDGDIGTDTVDVVLGGPLGAPVVRITTPDEETAYPLGDPVGFRGEATDTSTLADDLAFTWSSSLDGALAGAVSAGGQSALFADLLSAGTHVVTLTATDADGEAGFDTVTVKVEAEEVVAEPGDLVFSELMINPEAVEDEVGEWVELYNTSGSPIDVAGYTFRDDDTDAWVLEGPILVAAADYVVLCANVDPTLNGGIACDGVFFRDSTGNGLALANGPDEVVLTRPDGVDIDFLHYEELWYVPGFATGLDPSWLRSGDNDDVTHWCNAVTLLPGAVEPGTPGSQNDLCGEM